MKQLKENVVFARKTSRQKMYFVSVNSKSAQDVTFVAAM